MRIKDFAELVYSTQIEKGFAVPGQAQNVDQKLLLAVGELVEAQNCLRAGRTTVSIWYREDGKPEGFRYELADAIIRIMNIASQEGIDIEAALQEKAAFNTGREFMHGKAF